MAEDATDTDHIIGNLLSTSTGIAAKQATLDAAASGNPILLSELDYSEIFKNAIDGELNI